MSTSKASHQQSQPDHYCSGEELMMQIKPHQIISQKDGHISAVPK